VWAPQLVWTTWRRENVCPCRNSNSGPSVVQPLAGRYSGYCTALCTQVYCLYCDLSCWIVKFLALVCYQTHARRRQSTRPPQILASTSHMCELCAQRESAGVIPGMNEVGRKGREGANCFQPLQSSDARNAERYQLPVSRDCQLRDITVQLQ
jgi:hypothetical protein